MRICKVDGCDKKHHAKGYCVKHYTQFLRFGKTKRTYSDPNEFIIKNDICIIKLYDKFGCEKAETIIDAEDYKLCKNKKWFLLKTGYAATHYGKKIIRLHNLIMDITPNKIYEVDHKKRNKLDNRKSQLRLCTRSENSGNVALSKNNKSKFKGVSWAKKQKKWVAQIGVNGTQNFLGYFDNIIEAAIIYNEAALKHFGEFAYLNKV